MSKPFIVSLLALLMVASYGASEKPLYKELDILGNLENLDVPEDEIDDNVTFFDFSSFTSQFSGKNLVNVDSFGATGDGVSDDTQVRLSLRFICLFRANDRLSRYLKRYQFFVYT